MDNQNQQKKPFNKSLWVGIGIGFAAGGLICGTTSYCVSKKVQRKRYSERVNKERRRAYMDGNQVGYDKGYSEAISDAKNKGDKVIEAAYNRGVEDTLAETQKWMDENLIQVDSNDPEAIQKAIEAQKIASEKASKEENDEKVPEETSQAIRNDDIYAESGSIPVKKEDKISDRIISDAEVEDIFRNVQSPMEFSGRKYLIQTSDGQTLEYPIEIFCGKDGFLGTTQARENLREYEKNPQKIKLVWAALGWGDYYPEYDDGIPPAEIVNNYDLNIEDETNPKGVTYEDVKQMMEDAEDEEEPIEQKIERERYLDEVDRYRAHPEEGPRIISRQEFEEESRLEQIRIDYYDVDNVFLQPDSNDKELEDPIKDLGVTDGKELFEKRTLDEDEDPEVVYIKNFGQNFVAEVTRYHKSSKGLIDGSAYINGDTSVVRGTVGV